MTEVRFIDLTQALDRTMTVFKAMTDKLMAEHVTWANIQDVLSEDELAIFWALMRLSRSRDAAERIGRA